MNFERPYYLFWANEGGGPEKRRGPLPISQSVSRMHWASVRVVLFTAANQK